jgi:hypothetical protein
MEAEVSKFVQRRLHPVRVTVSLLTQQLELAKASKDVTMDRSLFDSVVSTLEIFLGDFDDRFSSGSERSERTAEKKFVEASKSTIKI